MLIGEKIYKLRKMNGLSQENLATKLNVSRQAVSKWETGVVPDIDNVLNIARFFDCSLDYLLNDDIESIEGSRKGDKDSINQVGLTQKKQFKLSENLMINIILIVPVLATLIMWVLYKIVDFPIVHQDNKSGSFYTGFGGFIDYFNLHGLLYICVLIWLVGILTQVVWQCYVKPKKKGFVMDRKIMSIYIARFLLFLFGSVLFIHGILNPWKFSWTTQTVLVLSVYFIVVISVSIIIKNFENEEKLFKKKILLRKKK